MPEVDQGPNVDLICPRAVKLQTPCTHILALKPASGLSLRGDCLTGCALSMQVIEAVLVKQGCQQSLHSSAAST